MTQLANKKAFTKVAKWVKSITNHLIWVPLDTEDGDEEVMLAKWESLLYHLINRHSGFDNLLYRQCYHGPLEGERRKDWFDVRE